MHVTIHHYVLTVFAVADFVKLFTDCGCAARRQHARRQHARRQHARRQHARYAARRQHARYTARLQHTPRRDLHARVIRYAAIESILYMS